MRHLVAGGAGFLGSTLVDTLLASGHEVVAVDDLCTGSERNLADARRHAGFAFVRGDVSQPMSLPGRFTHVWNLASPASPPDYLRLPIHTLRVGAHGTMNLLEIARAHDARFLMASTSEIYGDPTVSPQPESYWGNVNSIGPRSVYDEAKRFSEAAVMAYQRTYGMPTRLARIFNTYGPRMRLDDGRVIPNFLGQALRGEPLTVYGAGQQTRSFCYVDDEIDGLVRLMSSDHPGPMNIGNPREMTILELVQTLEKILGRPLEVVRRPLPEDDPKQRRPDITLARRVLGWEPRVTLEDGLQRTLAYFVKAGS